MTYPCMRMCSAGIHGRSIFWLPTFMILMQLLVPLPVHAAPAHRSSTTQTSNVTISGTSNASSLDLSSSIRALTAGSLVSGRVSIREGGTRRTISGSDLLTPGEFVALQEVLSTGQQTLRLGPAGTAIRGSFQLTTELTQHVSSLVVPRGVTAIDDFARTGTLILSGDLTNAGTFYAVSSSPAVTTASISAANIVNQQGAVFTSVLPKSGLPGMSNLSNSLSLSMQASNNIVNAGTLAGGGSLTVTAGGSITNALPRGATGANPVLQAVNAVNLQAPNIANAGLIVSQLATINVNTPRLANSGTIQAPSGNIQIANLTGTTLTVQNSLGMITAQNEVAFQTLASSSESKAELSVVGGIISANNVSFVSPQGRIKVAVDRINGSVYVSGGTAEIGVRQGDLKLIQVNLTGDPVFTAGGNLNLPLTDGTYFTKGGDFVALAGGDITASGVTASSTVDARNTNGQGGAITLAAGVTFDANNNITGASATGGNVNLPTVSFITKGDINMEAHPGTAAAGSLAVGDVQTSGNFSITTADLKLGTASMWSVTGSSSIVTVNSPAGSGLMVELPSGSCATIQTNGFRAPSFFQDLAKILDGPDGSIRFIPAPGQALTFSDRGLAPTTLRAGGLLVTSTTDAATTVGSGVTLAASGPIVVAVKDNTLFNNGEITTSAPAADGLNNWRTINITGNGGTLTLDGNSGVLSATGIANPKLKGGPAAPLIVVGAGATNLVINQSITFNLPPTGLASINSTSGGAVNLAAGVTITVTGGDELPPAYAQVALQALAIHFGPNTSVVSTRTSGTAIVLTGLPGSPVSVTLPVDSFATLSTRGGAILITPTTVVPPGPFEPVPHLPLTIAKSAATGTATLYLTGGPAIMTTSSTKQTTGDSPITIDAGVKLAADSGITINVNYSSLINNGIVQTSGASSTTVRSNGDMTLSGSGTFQASGTASFLAMAEGNSLTISDGTVLTISGTGTFESAGSLGVGNGARITATGGLALTAGTGLLLVGNNAQISTSDGNISLQNRDSGGGGSIEVGTGAILHAASTRSGVGQVQIFLGSTPAQMAGPIPPNVSINTSGGANVFFGANGITAQSPTNTLNAFGRNIVFDTAGLPASAIRLDGEVQVTADPPLTAAGTIAAHSLPSRTASTLAAPPAPDLGQSIEVDTAVATAGNIQSVHTADIYLLPNVAAIDAARLIMPDTLSLDSSNQRAASGSGSSITETDTDSSAMHHVTDEGTLVPIAFVRPATPTKIITYHTAQGRTLIKHSGTAHIAENQPGILTHYTGEVLISASEHVKVNAQGHQVEILPGAVTLIKPAGGATKLICLYSSSAHGASAILDKQLIEIGAGEEILIATDRKTASAACQVDQVGRRRLVRFHSSSGEELQRSEVSIVTIFQSSDLLTRIRHSDHKTDRSIAAKLIKMAACLTTATVGHGSYQRLTP